MRLTGGATANGVQGNLIGVSAPGTSPLGNGIGVQVGVNVDGTASTNVIGGVVAGAGNEIAFNTTIGVVVGQSSSDNAIFGNSIHQNGTLGIDLIGNGVTPNDLGDIDEGANNLTNFPVLTGAAGGVQGTLNSIPDTTFRIEFFGNTACDASGNGEGQLFLGSSAVTTDANGNATIPLFAVAAGQFVTATATDSSSNTSEFSACVTPLAVGAEIEVSVVDTPDPVVVGGQLSYAVTVTNHGPSPATDVRLSALWNGPFNVDATGPTAACELTPLLTCSFGTIASGATVTLGIVGTPGAIGLLGSTFTLQADEADPVPANNAVAVNTNVVGGPFSFVVTNTNDTGAGSLRQAILNANASVGADVISFAIPGVGVHTITPGSVLPTITDGVTVDGATQPGFNGTPIIELNGNGLPTGITVSAANTTIRGLVINRFGGGIGIIGNSTTNTIVQGNYIGTDATGTNALPNQDGIGIGNTITSPTNTLIGGTTAAARNVISGNSRAGVLLITGTDNRVLGNYIGTSADGLTDLGNGGSGVWIVSSGRTTVGESGAGNVISGNNQHGILVFSASGHVVNGNLIGTDPSGNTALPNTLDGVRIESAANTEIGGIGGAGNVIRFNGGSGVIVMSPAAGNRIVGNSISDNGQLGIDLEPVGVTPNDAGDVDAGANSLQNFPVLTAAAGGVEGSLNSIPNTTFRVEFFGNTVCDASGNGEGATFLGASSITTDANGNATIPLFTAAAGQFVTATATDSSNNTSEFSACVLTAESTVITLTATDADAAELGGNTGTVVVTRTGTTTLDRDVAISLDGTSFHQIDYTISSPTLVTSAPGGFTVRILAGETTATVTLTPIFSPLVEGPETAVFSAEGSTATVTIADEPPVTLTATDPDASELGANTATISVSRTVAAGYDRDVAISLDGTSFHLIDYTISSPTLVTSAPGALHGPHPRRPDNGDRDLDADRQRRSREARDRDLLRRGELGNRHDRRSVRGAGADRDEHERQLAPGRCAQPSSPPTAAPARPTRSCSTFPAPVRTPSRCDRSCRRSPIGDHRRDDAARLQRDAAHRPRWRQRGSDVERPLHRQRRIRIDDSRAGYLPLRHGRESR